MKKIIIFITTLLLTLKVFSQEYTITDTFVVFHHPTEDVVVNTGGNQVWNTLNSFHTGNAIRYFSSNGNAANSGLDSLHPLPYIAIDTLTLTESTIILTKRGETVPDLITINSDYVRLCTGWGIGDTTVFDELVCDTALYPNVQIGNVRIVSRSYGTGEVQYLTSADYYVSENATGSGDGTLGNEWTFAQAQSAASAGTLTDRDANDTISLGLFSYESFYGTLTIAQSGSSTVPIVVGTYGAGAKAKICGDSPITGWSLYSGNIYRASFASATNQLFLNGVKMKAARTPNTGYYNTDAVPTTSSYTSSSLNSGINYTGAVSVNRTADYAFSARNVTSSSGTTIQLASAPTWGLDVDNGFFLMNKLEFLDEAGEWYYDATNQYIYFWTPNGDSPANYTVTASVYANGIVVSNHDYITIQNLEIVNQQQSGIYGISNSNINIINNTITDAEGLGIYLYNTSNSTVSNNTLSGFDHNAIRCSGTDNEISFNTISDVLLFDKISLPYSTSYWYYGNAIFTDPGSDGAIIKNNDIKNIGYVGIAFYGRNTIVEYNRIDSVLLTLGDGAAIYTDGQNNDWVTPASQGSVIRYNIVSNAIGNSENVAVTYNLVSGIYLDEHASKIEVYNNTVFNCTTAGVYGHFHGYDTIAYNVCYNNGYGIRTDDYYARIDGATNRIIGNTLISLSGTQYCFERENYSLPVTYDVQDSNYYYSPVADAFSLAWGGLLRTYSEWQTSTGLDANSTLIPTTVSASDVVLFYNATMGDVAQDLSGYMWEDLDGNSVSSLTLGAFESKVLIRQ